MDFTFEWHPAKAALNERKHRVSFNEAITVFDDPRYVIVKDVAHSIDEERFFSIGWSSSGRLLLVSHTERTGRIRIISARKATKHERGFYIRDL